MLEKDSLLQPMCYNMCMRILLGGLVQCHDLEIFHLTDQGTVQLCQLGNHYRKAEARRGETQCKLRENT